MARAKEFITDILFVANFFPKSTSSSLCQYSNRDPIPTFYKKSILKMYIITFVCIESENEHMQNQLRSISRSWKGRFFNSSEIYRMKKQACKKKLLYWCGKIRFPNLKSTPSKYIHERALPKLQLSTFVLRCKLVQVLLQHTRREHFVIFSDF